MKQFVVWVSAFLLLSTGLYGDVVFLHSGQALSRAEENAAQSAANEGNVNTACRQIPS